METRSVKQLLQIAAMALLCAAAVFILGIRTRWGQKFGDIALLGRLQSSPELRRGALDVLDTLQASSVVVIGGALVLFALIRRRSRLAGVICVVLFVAIAGAEFLKRTLVRPDFGIDPQGLTNNWAPSGHTTVAISLIFCALMVVPRRMRTVVAVIGALYAAAIASGTLAAGWHRPTDAVMATFWSFAIATVGVALLIAWRGPGTNELAYADRQHPRFRRAGFALAVGLPLFALGASFAIGHDPVVWTQPSSRFIAASIVIDLTAVTSVLVFSKLLEGISLDQPHDAAASR
ncbi:MAG: phosphatase PAP2 family protein [Acidimicrobiales bacterium]